MSALALFALADLPQRCSADRRPRSLSEVDPRNRRFTDPRLVRAPLALHGRLDKGWDLDAAAEPEGTVAEHYITVEDDALEGADWTSFLAPEWEGRELTDYKAAAHRPLVWLNGPFTTPKGWGSRQGWKDAWVERAQQQAARGLLVWMLFPYSVLPAIEKLEDASDCRITTTGWRADFASPCSLTSGTPRQDVYLLARIAPPGHRDFLTGTAWRVREDGLVVPLVKGAHGGKTFDTRWREA